MKSIAALFAALALVACGGGGGGEPTRPKPVATVSIDPIGLNITLGGTLQLSAIARDASGNPLAGKTIVWSSNNTAVATVGSSDGLVQTVAVGTAYIVAVSDGKRDSVLVNVQPSNPANAPQINSISAPVLAPGMTVTLTGVRFGVGAGANVIRINGVLVSIVSATATEIVITIPLTGFPCTATHNATITVTANGETGTRTYPLAVAVQRALTIGQSVTVLPGAPDLTCNELANGGRFMISGYNASTTRSTTITYQLVTAAGIAAAAATQEPAQQVAGTSPSSRLGGRHFAGDFRRDEIFRRGRAHRDISELSREAVRRVGSPKKYFRARESASPAMGPEYVSARPAVLAETTLVRIPSINASGFCSNFTEVSTRTVYVGTKVIIKEDVANPLFNQMDGLYQQLGQEYDRDMAPILEANFGNTLALDDSLDNNDRIVMVFSKTVNDLGRVAGFVVSCDYYPRDVFPSSNFGETFYAIVPTVAAAGFASGTRDSWYRSIRSVVMHEAKHITSFAEKISRSPANNPVFEESWLEEGTAMHAEELWARPIYGVALRGNATYRPTLYCDVRPTFPECAGRPYVMFDHFSYNYDYLETVENLTPLGAAQEGDATFYGSAWSLVRWAIDHYATTDAALLKPLTQEIGVTGVANLSERTGRSWPEMLADWTLASAVDDYPSFTPARAQLALLSWNTREIYFNMSRDFATNYPRPFPLVPRTLAQTGTQDVPSVRGGTAAFFELDAPASSKTLLELRSAGGGPIPSTLGIAIVRVQ